MFRVESVDADCFVHVTGDLDMVNTPRLVDILASLDGVWHTVFLDLQKCEYIDSTAIGAMVRARKDRGPGFRVLLREDGHIARVLTMCGLKDLLSGADAFPG